MWRLGTWLGGIGQQQGRLTEKGRQQKREGQGHRKGTGLKDEGHERPLESQQGEWQGQQGR